MILLALLSSSDFLTNDRIESFISLVSILFIARVASVIDLIDAAKFARGANTVDLRMSLNTSLGLV